MVDSTFSSTAAAAGATGRGAPGEHGKRRLTPLQLFLFLSFVTSAGALLLRGWAFYSLGLGERVDHPDFRVLGPGANLGHGYGIAGTLLILTNLLYLVRRRFARLSLGSLRAWLDVHVFTGLFGSMLVAFHSAFQARSTIAVVTVVSLGVVVVTGLLGRYLYSLSPKPDLLRLEEQLSVLDAVGPGMGQALRQRMALVASTEPPARPSLLRVLWTLPSYRREARQRRATLDQLVQQYTVAFAADVALVARAIAECRKLYVGQVQAEAAGSLLKSWRGVHRFAALLMVLLVALHIAVAWYYGFVWVFSE